MYYKTLSGDEIHLHDPTEQARWLLNELSKEYYSKEDDSLVKAAPSSEISLLADIEQITSDKQDTPSKKDQAHDRKLKLDRLSFLMDNLNQLQIFENQDFLSTLSKIQKGLSDELVTRDKQKDSEEAKSTDKEGESADVKVKSEVKHVPDEL